MLRPSKAREPSKPTGRRWTRILAVLLAGGALWVNRASVARLLRGRRLPAATDARAVRRLLDQGHTAEATRAAEALLARQPTDVTLISLVADAHVQSDGFDRAEEVVRRGLDAVGGDDLKKTCLLRLKLGRCQEAQGRLDDAVGTYRKVVAAEPKNRLAAIRLASLLLRQTKFAESEQVAVEAIDPTWAAPRLYSLLGAARFAQGNTEGAMEAYHKVIESQPLDAEALCGLGEALIKSGNRPEARRVLVRAVRAHPRNTRAQTLLNIARH